MKSITKNKDRISKIWFSFQNAKTDKDNFKVPIVTRWTPIESTYLYDMLIEMYDLENNGSLDIFYYFLAYKYSKTRIVEIHNGIYGIIQQVLKNPKINIKDIVISKNRLLLK